MEQWQYVAIIVVHTPESLSNDEEVWPDGMDSFPVFFRFLNKWGQIGFELVAVVDTTGGMGVDLEYRCFFKRRIVAQSSAPTSTSEG